MGIFEIVSDFQPKGDQPEAIQALTEGILRGDRFQTLLGVTGSGKTFTMAQVIANVNRPALIISHNKTLAAQLFGEFSGFFPKNAVEFFISYYDYYQPEAYIPSSDTYIEKDSSVNEEIDRLRLRATSSLMQRRDVIIVSSVSCIYGLGSPEDFRDRFLTVQKDQRMERRSIMERLIDIHYLRNDTDFRRGTFRVRGDVIEIFPAYEEHAIRIELWGDQVDSIMEIDPLTGEVLEEKQIAAIYPAKHFVTTFPKLEAAIKGVRQELKERLETFHTQGKLLEAQRLESRTLYDLEMMQEIGYCNGIENYSRHLARREAGSRAACLLDYFPKDFIILIDESHVTIPQIRGMYNGDRSRKVTLVEHGFRLPSALDNRPLRFDEFEALIPQAVFISATPAEYELEKSGGVIVEQIIRPTGLMDPEIVIRPTKGQIDDLIHEIQLRVAKKERILVTTLTKRMAEDLAEYLADVQIKVRYLHSEIDALERVDILRGLRLGEFDVLVGINLLREGLDLPEVSLVAILDADKEGFLRSERSLIQTAGRAARNVSGQVVLYADEMTQSIKKLISETDRRRKIQKQFNDEHGITPQSIYKSVNDILTATSVADRAKVEWISTSSFDQLSKIEKEDLLDTLEREMLKAAENLDFERAAEIRDEIMKLKGQTRKKTGNRSARRRR